MGLCAFFLAGITPEMPKVFHYLVLKKMEFCLEYSVQIDSILPAD